MTTTYEQLPKWNVDSVGPLLHLDSTLGGDRLDAFLVQIPGETPDVGERNQEGEIARAEGDPPVDSAWKKV